MNKLPIIFCLLFLIQNFSFIIPNSYARVTPEDIVNSQRAVFNQKAKNYSLENKQKLTDYERKISALNKKITKELEINMLKQGEILDEYVRRNKLADVENARYWLTYAHEAVAFQAAKIYIFNLTSQPNINKDINSIINMLESDIKTLSLKVTKSQNIIKQLIKS